MVIAFSAGTRAALSILSLNQDDAVKQDFKHRVKGNVLLDGDTGTKNTTQEDKTRLRGDQRLLVILRTTLDLAGKKALSGAAFEVVQFDSDIRGCVTVKELHDYVPEFSRKTVFKHLRRCQNTFEGNSDWSSDSDSSDSEDEGDNDDDEHHDDDKPSKLDTKSDKLKSQPTPKKDAGSKSKAETESGSEPSQNKQKTSVISKNETQLKSKGRLSQSSSHVEQSPSETTKQVPKPVEPKPSQSSKAKQNKTRKAKKG